MKAAIENYYKRVGNEREYPILRTEKIDLAPYTYEFGYELPKEIQDYINIYWHTYISGYCKSQECIVLFSVLKRDNDSASEMLYYEQGLISLARSWKKIGDINKYIPIGWLGYSGGWVLYEIATGRIYLEDIDSDTEGVLETEPIAGSLVELINKLDMAGITT